MMWLERHSAILQALAAMVMAAVAIAALIGVKMQVDASYLVQREQSAKEIYREFLNISIGNPDFARPDYCALEKSPKASAYEAYVEYLLYTAEQVLQNNAEWKSVFAEHMLVHKNFICQVTDWSGYSDEVEQLALSFKAENCQQPPSC